MVQVQADGNVGPLGHIDDQGNNVLRMGQLLHLSHAHLHDNGGMLLAGGFDDRTHHFHIDTVDSHDGVAVPIGVVKHIFHIY